jgi:hypothetical protein
MAQIIEVLRYPELGFEMMAECEHCAERYGELRGCEQCDYRGYRQLTEDEEDEMFGV